MKGCVGGGKARKSNIKGLEDKLCFRGKARKSNIEGLDDRLC